MASTVKRDINKGRPPGTPNPDGKERIRRNHGNLYSALLQKALSGNAEAVRLCFELTEEHPKMLLKINDPVE